TAGGPGLAPPGKHGDGWAYFESGHGSAPHIARRGLAHPTATPPSPPPVLHHMGFAPQAPPPPRAGARVYPRGQTPTPAHGGGATTREMARAVLAAYQNA